MTRLALVLAATLAASCAALPGAPTIDPATAASCAAAQGLVMLACDARDADPLARPTCADAARSLVRSCSPRA